MSLEEKLKTPEGCYELGKELSDAEFERYKEAIAGKIAKNAGWSCYAGEGWPEEKFNPVAEIIARGVAKNALESYWAGQYWSDEKFKPVAEIIARGVAKDPKMSCWAGKSWSEERFFPYAEMFAKKVAEDADWSYCVGLQWSEERFFPYAEMFARKIVENEEFTYKAATEWKDERFEECANIFLPAIKGNPSLLARDYSSRRRNLIEIYDVGGDTALSRLNKMSKERKEDFLYFVDRCDKDKLIALPLIDFYRAADVLDYVKPHGGEKKFFESFNVILGRGEVRPWTREILKRIENVGKGGTNYRVLEVAV